MKHIKNKENFLKTEAEKKNFLSEAELIKDSTTFNDRPNTSSHVESASGRFSVWLNGGNAFRFKVDKDLLKKLGESYDKTQQVEAKLMELISKTMADNLDQIIKDALDGK